MANKPKTKTRKNRVKIPNVGPGKSISAEERKPVTTSEPINPATESTNIIKSKAISIIYFIFGVIVFYISYFGAKKRGTLINMGE